MTAALPLTDVGVIAGVLGLFFLLVAFYKSIFHRRRTPAEALSENEAAPGTRDDSQPIRINDPFQNPGADPPTAETAAQPDPAPPQAAPDPEPTANVTALRQFTPPQEGGPAPGRTDSGHAWE